MKNIIVKINDAVQTVQQVNLVTNDGQATVIKAAKNVNYQFIDQATGRGPDHIITKRVGKDLHVSLEDEGQETDLIIEDFYDNDAATLIGEAENGQFYYYLPDTGEVADYVTQLAIGDVEGQALGGNPVAAPWWLGATEAKAAIWPWLIGGLLGAGGIAALASDDDDAPAASNNNNTPNQAGGETTPAQPNQPNNGGETTPSNPAQPGNNGEATPTQPNNNGETTPNNPEQNGNTGNGDNAPNQPSNGGETTPSNPAQPGNGGEATKPQAPTATPNANGSVDVGLPEQTNPGDVVEVTFTPKGANEPVTVVLTKQPDGSWKSENPAVLPSPAADKPNTITIPADQIGGDHTVSVVAKDPAGNFSETITTEPVDAPDTTAPSAPVLTANKDGSVGVELPKDAEAGDVVIINVVPEGQTDSVPVTLTKNEDGTWISNSSAIIPNTTAANPNGTTIPANKVNDGSEITAVAQDTAGNKTPAKPATALPAPKADKPTVTAEDDGSVSVKPGPDNTEVVVKFTDENGKPQEITVKYDSQRDQWATDPEDDERVTISGPGKDATFTIPAGLIEDGSKVGATGVNENEVASDLGEDTAKTDTPIVTAKEDGTVDVKVPENTKPGDKVTVKVTDPATGEEKPVELVKNEDGSWTSNNPDVVPSIPKDETTATIPADKVKDGSPVTAITTPKDGKPSEPAQDEAKPGTPAPKVTANDDGSVGVEVPENAKPGDKVTVTVTDPATGEEKPVELVKNEDGSWTSNNPDVVPSIPKDETTATIPADKVKDGSPVTAITTPKDGKPSEPAQDEAKPGTPAPKVTANDDGSVGVEVPENAKPGDKVTVTVTDPATGEEKPVELVKNEDGSWTSNNPDVVPSIPKDETTATIPADKVKDGSPVTAITTPKDGKPSDPAQDEAKPGTPAPKVTANDDGSVGVEVPENAKPGDKVTVTVTDPATGEEKPVELVKNEDGSWTSNNPDVVPSIPKDETTATIPADKVKDGSPVTAITTPKDGKPSEPAQDEAKPGTPAPKVTANDDGSVGVEVPENAKPGDKVTVTVTDPATGEEKPVELVKNEDGSWTSNNPDVVPSIPKDETTATIPADKVKDGSPVTAITTPKDGKPSDPAQDEAKPGTPAPKVTANDDGSVGVEVPENAKPGDKVTVTVTDPATGEEKPVELVKNEDGSWTSNNPDVVPSIPKDETTATIPADKVKDGSPVTAITTPKDGKPSEPAQDEAKPGTPAPKVTANDDGSVGVEVPENAKPGDKVTVTVTDPATGEEKPVELVKNEDGSWTSNNPDVVPSIPKDETTATIPADKVKDGSPVTAITTPKDGKPSDPAQDEAKPGTPAPKVTANDDGSVGVEVPENAKPGDKVTVTVTDPATGEEKPVELVKNEDGSWTSNNPDVVPSIPKDETTATIPADKVKDGSPVTAITTPKDGKPSEPAQDEAKPGTPAPKVTANDDGSVGVEVPENAKPGDKVTVTVTDPATGEEKPVELVKNEDGSWTSNNPEVVPNIPKDETTATIPADKVKDGSPVTAITTPKDGKPSEPAQDEAKPGTPAPKVTANDDGSVGVEVPENAKPGDKVTVTVTDPATGEEKPVELVKNEDGSWTSNNPEVVPNIPKDETTATIPADKVKDGSPVTAITTPKDGKPSEPAQDEAKPGTPAPKVTANDDGSVGVEVPENAKPGDKVTVTVTDPATGEEKPVELVKNEDGSWTSNNPDVVPNIPKGETTATIPADKVKDGSPVTAITAPKDGKPSEPAQDEAKPGTPAPKVTANDDGSVGVEVPENAKPGDKVTVTVTDPATGEEKPVELVKNEDGSWTSNNPDVVPSIPKDETTATIPADKVKDGSPVTAITTPKDGKPSDPAQDEAKPGTPAPKVTANDDGSVGVEVPENAKPGDKVTVTVTDPATGEEKPVELVKNEDGSWTSNNPDVVPSIPKDETTATIPADKVKDGSPVTAITTPKDGKPSDPAQDEAKPGTPAPKVTANDDGSVGVEVPENAKPGDKVTVTVTDPATGEEKPVELVKNEDGSWTSNNPDVVPSIPKDETTATIPADKVKDGSPVTAITTPKDGKPSDPAQDEAKPGTPAPKVTANDDGSVGVEVPENAKPGDKVTVTVTDPATGEEKPVELVKNEDGSWTSNNPDVVPSIPKDETTATIPADKVKDGSPVTAITTPKDGKPSDPAKDTTKEGGDKPGDNGETTPTDPAQPGDNGETTPTDPAQPGDNGETTPTDPAQPGDNGETTPTDPAQPGDNGETTPTDPAQPGDNGETTPTDPAQPGDNGETTPTDPAQPGDNGETTPTDPAQPGDNGETTPTDPAQPGDNGETTPTDPAQPGDNGETTPTDPAQPGDNGETTPTDPAQPGDNGETTPTDPAQPGDNGETTPTDPAQPGDNGETTPTDEKPAEPSRTAPSAPTVTFDKDQNADGILSGKEKAGANTTTAKVTIPEDAKPGDTLKVTVGGEEKSISLTPEMIAQGSHTVDVPVTKDGPVTVTAKVSTPEGLESAEGSKSITVDTTAPSMPVLTPNSNGSVGVGLPKDANVGDTVEVRLIPENGEKLVTVTLTKGANGWTSDDPNLVPNTSTDSTTIPEGAVKDRTTVYAVAKDPVDNVSDRDSKLSLAPAPSKVKTVDVIAPLTFPGAEGSKGIQEGNNLILRVTMDNNTGNSKVPVNIGRETATQQDYALNTEWKATNGVTFDPSTGNLNVPKGVTTFDLYIPVVRDGIREPNETGRFGVGGVASPRFTIMDNLPQGVNIPLQQPPKPADKPTVTPSTTDGSVSVQPGPNNTKLTVTYTDEKGQKQTVELEKTGNTWAPKAGTTVPAGVEVQPNGTVNLPQDNVGDGKVVTAIGENADKQTAQDAKQAPADSVEQPAEQPAEKPAEQPSEKPAEQPATPPAEEKPPVEEQPAEEPATPPAEEPAKPAEEPATPPAEEPAKPAEEPATPPAEEKPPVEEQPAEEPATPPADEKPPVEEPEDPIPPVMSIKVEGDISSEIYPATSEDNNPNTGLTYTVSLDKAAKQDITVSVQLSGRATTDDYTMNGSPVSNPITVRIPAGQTSASFKLDPVIEASEAKFNYEGPETVIATLSESADGSYTLANKEATGIILDANPISLKHLDGDLSLAYGVGANNADTDQGETVSTVKGKFGSKDAGDAIVATNLSDKIYIGYYSDGSPSSSAGNLSNSQDDGPANKQTDNAASTTTVDLGMGDDFIRIRGDQRGPGVAPTKVYMGEGNDTYELGGDLGGTATAKSGYVFGEAGNDTFTIGGHLNGQVYGGSGSDTITVGKDFNGIVDFGSGRNLTAITENGSPVYLTEYADGSGRSLGNDNNTDTAQDTNTLTVGGAFRGQVYGGEGKDIVRLTTSGTVDIDKDSLHNVEVLDLAGKITLKDLTSNNAVNLNGLHINGDASDKIDLGTQTVIDRQSLGTWKKTGTSQYDGHSYDVWTDSSTGVVLNIEQGIHVY
ncbi:hypothetical protein ACFBZI_06070 [Moraxella sp. ZJ142]|uniref:hypothetical protein n=1 Tax=Moraxella marmotae TaxID=3344520 RepID=UPI0035D501E7